MDAPAIQYTRTADGVNIAYWTRGEGPPTLLLHPIAISHLGMERQVPSFRETHALIAQELQLMLYDARATGLSGPAQDLTPEAFVRDIPGTVHLCDVAWEAE